jgi:hypothetical protein
MATCPNKTLQSWKDLVNSKGEDMAYYLWDKYEGNIPESEYAETGEVMTQPTSPETDELSLYLSNKMNENFKISTPELKGAPSIDAIVTNHVPVNQTDIDTKKEEC